MCYLHLNRSIEKGIGSDYVYAIIETIQLANTKIDEEDKYLLIKSLVDDENHILSTDQELKAKSEQAFIAI